eukprot:m.400380 g.400380  ORF g.400380 m.400380 type:complete len:84 (-) comp21159_c0_seq14:55-306(-)
MRCQTCVTVPPNHPHPHPHTHTHHTNLTTCPLLHISSGLDFDTNEASEVQNVASSSTFQSVKAELRQALEQHFNSDSVTAPKN